jgi:hypothetical protein
MLLPVGLNFRDFSMEYLTISNLLPQNEFIELKSFMESNNMPWFFYPTVGDIKDNSDSYFTHTFFDNGVVNSNYFNMLFPILRTLKDKKLIRARANLYTPKQNLIEHAKHTDYDFKHKTLILYVNTNDGFTRLGDDIIINSVENTGVLFDGSEIHNSTNCTNAPCRINIVISYF